MMVAADVYHLQCFSYIKTLALLLHVLPEADDPGLRDNV